MERVLNKEDKKWIKRLLAEFNVYGIAVMYSTDGPMSEMLPQGAGYDFCKIALDLCMKWIQMEEMDLGDLYDCLDSPEEVDFTYYEELVDELKNEITLPSG